LRNCVLSDKPTVYHGTGFADLSLRDRLILPSGLVNPATQLPPLIHLLPG
jgi:hypothetical protein